jgi:hypothetical protein
MPKKKRFEAQKILGSNFVAIQAKALRQNEP